VRGSSEKNRLSKGGWISTDKDLRELYFMVRLDSPRGGKKKRGGCLWKMNTEPGEGRARILR